MRRSGGVVRYADCRGSAASGVGGESDEDGAIGARRQAGSTVVGLRKITGVGAGYGEAADGEGCVAGIRQCDVLRGAGGVQSLAGESQGGGTERYQRAGRGNGKGRGIAWRESPIAGIVSFDGVRSGGPADYAGGHGTVAQGTESDYEASGGHQSYVT